MKNAMPFKESEVSENVFLRTFHQDVHSEDLVWHRDLEDRVIESIGDTDWMLQLDDELPKRIQGQMFIPVGVYHRLIKGTGDLKIKMKKF